MISNTDNLVEFKEYVLLGKYDARDPRGYNGGLKSHNKDDKLREKSSSYKKRLKQREKRLRNSAKEKLVVAVTVPFADNSTYPYSSNKAQHADFNIRNIFPHRMSIPSLREAYRNYVHDATNKIEAGQEVLRKNKRKNTKGMSTECYRAYMNMCNTSWSWYLYSVVTNASGHEKEKKFISSMFERVRHPYSKNSSKYIGDINVSYRPTKKLYSMLQMPAIKTQGQFFAHMCGIKRVKSMYNKKYVKIDDILNKFDNKETLNKLIKTIKDNKEENIKPLQLSVSQEKAIKINQLAYLLNTSEDFIYRCITKDMLVVTEIVHTYKVVDFNKFFIAKMQYDL